MSSTPLMPLDIVIQRQLKSVTQASECAPRSFHPCHQSQLLDRFVRPHHVDRQLVAKWLLIEGEWD